MTDEDVKRLLTVMQDANTSAHAETRRHFDVAVENMEKRFDRFAEAIGTVDDKLDRRVDRLEDKIDRGFAET